MIITYLSSDEAIQACYTLKDAIYEERSLSGWLTNTSSYIQMYF